MPSDKIAGRYRVLRAIGRGGMGAVWLCHDEILGRDVAVKQMGALPGEDSASTTRAMREARVSAAMNHENAVAVYDVVDYDNGTWLVMEYFPSQTLADLISAEGPLQPERVARIGAQVAAALASAHGLGIVHRDVKPGNILVGEHDEAKLSDFGIARGHTDLSLTQTGMMTGTPGYFSPELARGEDPSFASDAWALGVTLYTASEGTPPYPTQANPLAVLSAITREPPPSPQHAGPVGPVIEALMQPDPERRWPVEQVRRELDQITAGQDAGHTRAFPVPAVADVGGGGAPAGVDGGREEPLGGEDFSAQWHAEGPADRVDDATSDTARPERRMSRAWWIAAVVALILIGAGVVGYAVLGPDDSGDGNNRTAAQGGGGGPTRAADPSGGTTPGSPTTDESTAPSTDTTDNTDTTDTTGASSGSGSLAAAEDAVRHYYTLVPDDIDAGWDELTPRFQAETGRQSYDDFWGSIDSVELTDVEAVSPTVVDYTISYDGSSPENKQITLVQDGSSYLIDDDNQQ